MPKLIHQVGLVTSDGESFVVVFTDEHAWSAVAKIRNWALNPKLTLTHTQADKMIEAILTRNTSKL